MLRSHYDIIYQEVPSTHNLTCLVLQFVTHKFAVKLDWLHALDAMDTNLGSQSLLIDDIKLLIPGLLEMYIFIWKHIFCFIQFF